MIEEIYQWRVECTPWEKGPIRMMVMYVVAKTRKEAELIVIGTAYKFFDQDMHYAWSEPIQGYKEEK